MLLAVKSRAPKGLISVVLTVFIALFSVLCSGEGSQQLPLITVTPLAEMPLAEQQMLQAQGLLPAATNNSSNRQYYRWWLANSEAKTLSQVQLLTTEGEPLASEAGTINQQLNCYLLMTDTSRSMSRYWPLAQQLLKWWVSELAEREATQGLFGFAEDFYPIVPLGSDSPQSQSLQALEQLRLQGKDTQLYLAASKAVEVLQQCPASRKHLVIFSDGDAEDLAHTLPQVVTAAQAGQVSIHTLGFGDLTKSKTALKLQVLKALSKATQGHYQHIQTNGEFEPPLTALLNSHSLGGMVSFNPEQLAYGAENVTLQLTLSTVAPEVEADVNTDSVSDPDTTAPETTEPETAEPETTEPETADPETAEPETAEPETTEPETTTADGFTVDTVTLEQPLSVSETRQWANVLVSISAYTKGSNPWLVIFGALAVLLLIIAMYLWRRKGVKQRLLDQVNADNLERQQQEHAHNEKLQQALVQVQESIEQFKPEAPVNTKGEPFGYLQEASGLQHELIRYSSTIGRAEECDVVLNDSHTSAHHAILDFKHGQFIWTDRAPVNPTLLNGQALAGSGMIQPGDELTCGAITLRFVLV